MIHDTRGNVVIGFVTCTVHKSWLYGYSIASDCLVARLFIFWCVSSLYPTFSLLDSICKAKEEKKQNELKTLVSAFTEFYKQVYKVNDFSFASIASENTKDTKKEVLTKGLQIVKNFK